MEYVESFTFPTRYTETSVTGNIWDTCYTSYYPYFVLSGKGLQELSLAPLTILYGGNGSGKSTALNVMAEKLGLKRGTAYNRSSFYESYLSLCEYTLIKPVPEHSRIITSDDVFDSMLHIRSYNEGIDIRREEVFDEYYYRKKETFQLKSIADLEHLQQVNAAKKSSKSKYTKFRLHDNVREYSNGESGFLFFLEKIEENGFYLLDEPENSLSPSKQQELAKLLWDSVRYFGCQIVLSTHSPYLLAMKGARIYDLDSDPVTIKNWTELHEVRLARQFFRDHEKEFESSEL